MVEGRVSGDGTNRSGDDTRCPCLTQSPHFQLVISRFVAGWVLCLQCSCWSVEVEVSTFEALVSNASTDGGHPTSSNFWQGRASTEVFLSF
jgi:hypothetical protein